MGTFILDFQTIDFEPDAKIAVDMLSDYQRLYQLENSFALDPPVKSLGWSFDVSGSPIRGEDICTSGLQNRGFKRQKT
jgi:hypothetical protein